MLANRSSLLAPTEAWTEKVIVMCVIVIVINVHMHNVRTLKGY